MGNCPATAKIKYRSKPQALRALECIRRRRTLDSIGTLGVYLCRHCNHYHLGTYTIKTPKPTDQTGAHGDCRRGRSNRRVDHDYEDY